MPYTWSLGFYVIENMRKNEHYYSDFYIYVYDNWVSPTYSI